MAFAIFFEMEDAAAIAGTIQAQSLTNTLKNRVRPFWNGGIRDWASAPLGHAVGDDACPLCRVIVCTNGTLAEFRQLLLDVAAHFGVTDAAANYLVKLANEISQPWGGKEPYP